MSKRKRKGLGSGGHRSCPECGAQVAASARFCEHCGFRLEAASAPRTSAPVVTTPEPEPVDPAVYAREFEARESQQLATELYEAHAQLLRQYRKLAKALSADVDKIEQRLGQLASAPVTSERTEALQAVLEDLEGCGDRWEELQLDYNRSSEELDEDYADRCAEIEVDIELPEDLQTAMTREMTVTTATFDRIGERVQSLGRVGNGLLGGASGRWFGGSAVASSAGMGLWWLLAASLVATAAALHFVEGAPSRTIGIAVAAPALVFSLVLILALKRR